MRAATIWIAILLITCVTAATAKSGYGPGEQDWGFVDVRNGAHMFYWLYYTTANVTRYTERPLTIWLQGGPGSSSTGYGNFEELGPLNVYGQARNSTWVKEMNVLFIDSPVGSGFSYVDNLSYLTNNTNEIALDLVRFMKSFYKLHPEFEKVPLHIFCESYGGKTAHEFALELYYAIKRGEVRSNLVSVALGDPWVSAIDYVLSWAPMLLQMGIVDQAGSTRIADAAAETENLVKQGNWTAASYQWANTIDAVANASKGVDIYNVLKPTSQSNTTTMYRTMVQYDAQQNDVLYKYKGKTSKVLTDLMVGPVTKALGITTGRAWGSQAGAVFDNLIVDFMKPAIDIVVKLLNSTDVKVGVYSGQLDLICSTPGQVNWIDKMQWSYKSNYTAAPRTGIYVNSVLEGYEKSAGNFTFFWVNRSGHMVPVDNPAAMGYILRKFTNFG